MVVPMDKMRVALGAGDLEQQPELVLSVSQIFKHEKYIGPEGRYLYDIALLRLSEPVEYTTGIAPVCLSPTSLQSYDNLIAAGWGMTAWNGPLSTKLLDVTLTEVPLPVCQKSLTNLRVTPAHVCTNDVGKNVCKGDSGGPLVSKQQSSYYQAGIVSWGIKCGFQNKYPSVFTRVSSYLDWIEERTQDAQWCSNPSPAPVSAPVKKGFVSGLFSVVTGPFKFFTG